MNYGTSWETLIETLEAEIETENLAMLALVERDHRCKADNGLVGFFADLLIQATKVELARRGVN